MRHLLQYEDRSHVQGTISLLNLMLQIANCPGQVSRSNAPPTAPFTILYPLQYCTLVQYPTAETISSMTVRFWSNFIDTLASADMEVGPSLLSSLLCSLGRCPEGRCPSRCFLQRDG